MPVDLLTRFLDADGKARGRPVGVAFVARGAPLVADDVGNAILAHRRITNVDERPLITCAYRFHLAGTFVVYESF
jgi:hypothetical protein